MIKKTINYLKEDYNRRTLIFTGLSFFINLAFAIYNGVIGIVFDSLWHKCIFGYYVLLMLLKGILILGELYIKDRKQLVVIYLSFFLLIITTIAMIAPAVVLLQNKRSFNWGLIPAITMASYTTYSITMSIINITKAKKIDNHYIKQIRLINLVAAIMSILVLQNTLITVNGDYTSELYYLSSISSIGFILLVVFIVIYSFIRTIKNKNTINVSEAK